MSIFDTVSKLAQDFSGGAAGGDNAAVASGLLDHLGGAGGLGSLIQTFQQNGGGGLIQDIASGNVSSIDPNQVESLLAGSGVLDGVAAKTGLSSDQIKSSLGSVLPMLINHGISNGHVTADGQPGDTPAPDAGSLLQSLVAKLA